jgi:hypothetical protein
LPEAERRNWLVLQPAVFDQLVDTCDDLGPGSNSNSSKSGSSTAGNNGTGRLLLDELLDEAVGGQVRWGQAVHAGLGRSASTAGMRVFAGVGRA